MQDAFLTPSELAELLAMPEHTLAQWRYLGKGPAYAKMGKHVRYRRTDVETWLEAQTVNPAA